MELLFTLYALQVIYSFWMLSSAWRYNFDLKLGDAIGFGLLSFLPIAFIPATLIYLLERPYKYKDRSPIIVAKKF